jgi:hypothetical protein
MLTHEESSGREPITNASGLGSRTRTVKERNEITKKPAQEPISKPVECGPLATYHLKPDNAKNRNCAFYLPPPKESFGLVG